MLLKMDSPVETKMAAPRSWKTAIYVSMAIFTRWIVRYCEESGGLTVKDGSSRGNIFVCGESLRCHDGCLEC